LLLAVLAVGAGWVDLIRLRAGPPYSAAEPDGGARPDATPGPGDVRPEQRWR